MMNTPMDVVKLLGAMDLEMVGIGEVSGRGLPWLRWLDGLVIGPPHYWREGEARIQVVIAPASVRGRHTYSV